MAKYSPDEVGFLDEMLKDEREIGRRYGRSLRGTHAMKKQVSVQGCHTSMEALLSLDGIIVDMVVEGSMTKDLFLKYLENILPKCTAYPGPLSVLMMDNARIHHGNKILKLADCFGRL
ncbi:hypothetical protein L208DRAFT_1240716 [Tricholoma matsutake]|nr:hypothetical protein L208DRAFT_1240716 [Tricholoma matsutake 945]